MLFSWFAEHRRQNLLASQPFPNEWLEYLRADVPHYEYLSLGEQKSLRDHVQIFVAEKNWEALGGLTMTEEIQVSIAAQACLLLIGLEKHDFYPNVESILVYPSGYKAKDEQLVAAGVIQVGASFRLGEAWGRGPVVLSWSDALRGGRDPADGNNVVLHEFAHKLDMQKDGSADGVPALPGNQDQYDEWADVMSREYDLLVAASQYGRADLLDEYGATNPAEFFAVATETFFEKPLPMRERHSRLYDVLKGYYRQDTAARVEAAAQVRQAETKVPEPADLPAADGASPNRAPHAARPAPHALDASDPDADTRTDLPGDQRYDDVAAERVSSYLDRVRVTPSGEGPGLS